MLRKLCFYAFSLTLAGALLAHDFYLLPNTFKPSRDATIEIAFNNGDSFPESEAAPSLARLKDAQLRFSSGVTPVTNLKVEGKHVAGIIAAPLPIGSLLLTAHTIPNFIELAADKFLDCAKEGGLSHIIDWREKHGESTKPSRERYSKFAKSLLVSGSPDEFYRTAVGFPIEIIPESNPYLLHAGSELPVTVLFRGKPAPALQLEAAWWGGGKSQTKIIGRTDANGRIAVPIRATGMWRLHTLVMERCAAACSEPAPVDWESFWASLTFEIQ